MTGTSSLAGTEAVCLAFLAGDGIGSGIAKVTREVPEATPFAGNSDFLFTEVQIGLAAGDATGSPFPETVLDDSHGCDGSVLGPVSHDDDPPRDQGGPTPSGARRKRLDPFANLRPARKAPRQGEGRVTAGHRANLLRVGVGPNRTSTRQVADLGNPGRAASLGAGAADRLTRSTGQVQ